MNKEKLLTFAVIALFLLNLGTLGFLFFRRPLHPQRGGGPQLDRHIIEQLQLDAAQQQQFERLKSAHHEQIMADNRAYRETLDSYLDLLKNEGVVPAQKDSIEAVLTRIQNHKASVTFQHFAELKALCTLAQKQRFDALLPELKQVILPPPPADRR